MDGHMKYRLMVLMVLFTTLSSHPLIPLNSQLLEEYYAKPLKELIGKQKFITQPLYNKIFKGDLVIIRKTNSELYHELIENFEMERANKVRMYCCCV